jgi:hypothetical protein
VTSNRFFGQPSKMFGGHHKKRPFKILKIQFCDVAKVAIGAFFRKNSHVAPKVAINHKKI